MNIEIPEVGMVVLVGASGAGKSTFAREHFLPTEVLSSDWCRALVSDDATDQSATQDAFDLLHHMLATRLKRGRLTVIDATNVGRTGRQALLQIARDHDCLSTAIVLDLPEALCIDRNAARADRAFGAHVIRRQRRDLKRSLKHLKREGFRGVKVLRDPETIAAVQITRTKLWNDRRDMTGPFDLIGDVHGCFDELVELLRELGYEVTPSDDPILRWSVTPPQGRRAIFVGDLVDRGPKTPDVLALVMGMVEAGTALCVCGNHDAKLSRALSGRKVRTTHGLQESLDQLAKESEAFAAAVRRFLGGLISHYMLDGGRLCVAHAGLKASLQGRASGRVRSFAMYGETTGGADELGLPIRGDWAAAYRGSATVVYGHTPVARPEWVNDTICLDTGCVFGGTLTALRYPERTLTEVPAHAVHCEPLRPLEAPDARGAQALADDALDLGEVLGRQRVSTSLLPKITLPAERTASALEVMSRHGLDPRWLLYLPPTMAPCKTSGRPGFLEHPDEAFAYFQERGIDEVVCQAKHMGSRAVLVVLRDPEVARTRFGFEEATPGVIYTRTGRRFFRDPEIESALLGHVRRAWERGGWFERFETDWVCLDAELMPWSMKAQALLERQYAAVGAAARMGLAGASDALDAAIARGIDVGELRERVRHRTSDAARFVDAYRHYCWDVTRLEDYKIAPFHLLATEGRTHTNRDHTWHMETLAELEDEIMMATEHVVVNLKDEAQVAAAVTWWTERVERGEEGMVIKPRGFVARDGRGKLAQPAIKCRGPEYLRLIYGPEYAREANLERLRARHLGRKRTLALQEFALSVDALEQFVAGAPLRKVHQRVFGILALESERVDPRL